MLVELHFKWKSITLREFHDGNKILLCHIMAILLYNINIIPLQ